MELPFDFKKIINFSQRALAKKPESILALDIGASSVKVIQLKSDKGKAVLETYGELATGPYGGLAVGQAVTLSIEKTAELLRDLFKESNITTSTGSIAMPLRSSLLITMELPEMEQEELEKVIPIEARKYIPVPITEVALDWWIVPTEPPADATATPADHPAPAAKKTIEILIVAIHKDMIKRYEDIGKAIKLKNTFFEIETFSAIRSCMHNDLTATIIADLGASSTKVAVVDYGIIRLSHTINKGSQDITGAISRSLGINFAKAEEIKRKVGLVEKVDEVHNLLPSISPIVEYIFSELNNVMVNYQKKHHRSIDRIILIGGGALLPGLVEVAKKSVDVPVSLGNPFDKVETPAFLANILAEAGPGFAVAIGLALRGLQEL